MSWKRCTMVGVLLILLACGGGVAAPANGSPGLTPEAAIQRLKEGNARYVADRSVHPDLGPARRNETVQHGQHPFAAILACSDSRAPVEFVFDQGIGDLFVVRVAGNTCRVSEAGSIEYAVDHLGTPLLVVLGHTRCGAVTAAATAAELHGNTRSLVSAIRPAVEKAQKTHPDLHGPDLVPAAIEANVWQAIDDLLSNSAIVRKHVAQGKLKIVGATYDLASGKIQWLGEHRQQRRLLQSANAEFPQTSATVHSADAPAAHSAH